MWKVNFAKEIIQWLTHTITQTFFFKYLMCNFLNKSQTCLTTGLSCHMSVFKLLGVILDFFTQCYCAASVEFRFFETRGKMRTSWWVKWFENLPYQRAVILGKFVPILCLHSLQKWIINRDTTAKGFVVFTTFCAVSSSKSSWLHKSLSYRLLYHF
jgi:hypothetical protein